MSFAASGSTVQKIINPDCAGENQRYGTGQLAAEDDETSPEMQIQTNWLKNELCCQWQHGTKNNQF
ncbi:hypothetical protein OOP60_004867 [Salmonella enterica]|nr:hypothetical protein [Salmonella enterica subsp. houtenae serovar 40:z4,z24:-]EKB5404412.1 hypothetical protein [Salmonella enterica]EKB5476455.1 hypothetical protein [Salmonella enterica]ELL0516232.1 hypothetical protein [Salmonella enterica]HBZ8551539.1 hypothetical protein [Salmonella enterica subsp. houtenae]